MKRQRARCSTLVRFRLLCRTLTSRISEGATLGGFAIDETLKLAFRGDTLPLHVLRFVCVKLAEQLLTESNVLQLSSPVTVVGDISGYVILVAQFGTSIHSFTPYRQFGDLVEMFRVFGRPPDTNFL